MKPEHQCNLEPKRMSLDSNLNVREVACEVGANPNHHDRNRSLAALHMAVGYVRLGVTKLPPDLECGS
ncbi:hypothetical protein ACSQ67_021158 [Phaseolus vulgaris]